MELMENGVIVVTSKVVRAHTRASLHNIEIKINNLKIGLTDDVPSFDSNTILESNIDKPTDKVDAVVAHYDEREVQSSSKSLMHGFWAEKFYLFHKKAEQVERKRHPHPRISDGVDKAFQLNRYCSDTENIICIILKTGIKTVSVQHPVQYSTPWCWLSG